MRKGLPVQVGSLPSEPLGVGAVGLRGAHVHRYARVAKYLEITRRAEVLNKRLDIIKELFDMLASEYHNSHASMLEWIVIILILIEVFFQVLSLITDNGSISIFRTDD